MDEQFNTELCRCCLTDGSYKNLTETFQWMGEDEVYGDMLKDCFDVMICDSSIGGICDVCITQLRNASNFKKQVLQSEQKFKKKLEISLKGDTVKIEHVCENDQDSDTIDQDSYFEVLEAEMEVPIKEEVAIETKSRKRGMKLLKSETKAKRSKQDPETSTKGKLRKREKTKLDKHRVAWTKKTPEDLAKQQYNLLNILQLSNATPLRSKTGRGFNCAFCADVFQEPADLKIHNIKEHKDLKPKSIMNKKILYGNYVKLDITALQCSLCGVPLDKLPNLIEHLKIGHDRRLYTDVEDRILPFKFDTMDVTRCVVCSAEFVSFNMLQRHMNAHYRNHVCDVCDSGFVNKRLLRHHIKYTHQLGEFRCNFCEKVFGTLSKRNDHEKSVHFGFKRNKCAYCSERFVCYKKRNKHVVEVHNKPPIVYKCHACDKTFDMRYKLSQHTKKDHLMERKYECNVCDMKFFMKKELEKHMVKHSGEKNYSCEVCLKTYARKNTLREHMRIHANDRRFKCDKCSHAFVQKCAWRSHMRTKHDVTV